VIGVQQAHPMTHILTLTLNPALDCSIEADKVEPVHKVRTYNEAYAPGGGGINVARAVVRLGGNTTALYLAGGATGAFLGELLDKAGVAHEAVRIEGNTRISFNVFDHATGQDYRFVPEGPQVSEADIDRLLARVEAFAPGWIVASGSLPRGAPVDVYARMAGSASMNASRLVLDTSGEALKASIARGGLALIKPSIGELESIGGQPLKRASEAEEAALHLVKTGASEMVAVTLGKDGGFLADENGIFRIPAPKIEALSAVGAGDSFLAGMVQALSEGKSNRDAFRVGMAAGAAACLNIGTQLCHKEDVDRLLSEMAE
jgi:6-phosphofructokinase 2